MVTKNKIIGDVLHIPSSHTNNRFLIMGIGFKNGIRQEGQDVLEFRLTDVSKVSWLVSMLERIREAAAEWLENQTTGILWLKFKLTSGQTSGGGGEMKSIPISGIEPEIRKDPMLRRSNVAQQSKPVTKPTTPKPDISYHEPEPEPPRRGPDIDTF